MNIFNKNLVQLNLASSSEDKIVIMNYIMYLINQLDKKKIKQLTIEIEMLKEEIKVDGKKENNTAFLLKQSFQKALEIPGFYARLQTLLELIYQNNNIIDLLILDDYCKKQLCLQDLQLQEIELKEKLVRLKLLAQILKVDNIMKSKLCAVLVQRMQQTYQQLLEFSCNDICLIRSLDQISNNLYPNRNMIRSKKVLSQGINYVPAVPQLETYEIDALMQTLDKNISTLDFLERNPFSLHQLEEVPLYLLLNSNLEDVSKRLLHPNK